MVFKLCRFPFTFDIIRKCHENETSFFSNFPIVIFIMDTRIWCFPLLSNSEWRQSSIFWHLFSIDFRLLFFSSPLSLRHNSVQARESESEKYENIKTNIGFAWVSTFRKTEQQQQQQQIEWHSLTWKLV